MQTTLSPAADEQTLVTLHDGTQVSADTLTVALHGSHYETGALALEDDTVEDYFGDHLLADDAITFTHGRYEGQYAHPDDAVELLDDEYCCPGDDYYTTAGGEYFMAGDEDRHDLVLTADTEEWEDEDDCTKVRSGRNGQTTWYRHPNGDQDVIYCDGDESYYTRDYAERCDIYYSENLDGYYSSDTDGFDDGFDDDNDRHRYNAGYHDLKRQSRTSATTRFTVGFEVEKEDSDAVETGYYDLYEGTGWIKESDGSLDDETGFELVSPAFDLLDDGLDRAIAGSAELQSLLEAGISSDCGGHINFGIVGRSGQQTCELAAGWFPLIYAMFPQRARESQWSKMYKLEQTKSCAGGKYMAVAVHDNRIEFRVFSAVRSVRHLLYRRDLLLLLATNLSADPTQVLGWALDPDHALHHHLRRVYTEAKLLELVGRAVEFYHSLEEDRITLKVAFTRQAKQLVLPFADALTIPLALTLVEA